MGNLTPATLADFFTAKTLGGFFIKAFSVVFALIFLIYAVVTFKQIQEISRTVQNSRNKFILFISFLQIATGIALLVFAIWFV